MPFITENIHRICRVSLRVHKLNIDSRETGRNRLLPIAFQQKGDDGMSVDWLKYRSVEQSRNTTKVPDDNGVISLNVGDIVDCSIESMEVIHDPQAIELNYNQAHSLVKSIPKKDPNKTAIRRFLWQNFDWEIII